MTNETIDAVEIKSLVNARSLRLDFVMRTFLLLFYACKGDNEKEGKLKIYDYVCKDW